MIIEPEKSIDVLAIMEEFGSTSNMDLNTVVDSPVKLASSTANVEVKIRIIRQSAGI